MVGEHKECEPQVPSSHIEKRKEVEGGRIEEKKLRRGEKVGWQRRGYNYFFKNQ